MSSHHRTDLGTFEWRVATGRWRWLILGSLGMATNGCWGQTEEPPGGGPAGNTSLAGASKFHVCNDPVPLEGGWERCANGLVHRPGPVGECTSQLPRAQGIDPDVILTSYAPSECKHDSDCTAAPYGHCELEPSFLAPVALCHYGCVVGSDCSEGQICECNGGPIGSCVTSSCNSDADCAGDAMCAVFEANGCDTPAAGCQSPLDACATGADCGPEQSCALDNNDVLHSKSYCSDAACAIGRPFLVDGSVRLAPSEVRADWLARVRVDDTANRALTDLNSETRAGAAAGWLRQALMEHASVAAFARFSLQLLGLGAPAELVSAAAQAQADEIAHAQDCFALARRYGAGDIGPGPLSMTGALDAMDLRSVVIGTIAEGCIGETLAALEAAEARSHCTDPAVRAVLERIAADETRHAQLAWRFVSWALETGPESLRADVHGAFAREIDAAYSSPPTGAALDRSLLEHGLMPDALRPALRSRVLCDVIAPCAEARLAGARSPQAQTSPGANGAGRERSRAARA